MIGQMKKLIFTAMVVIAGWLNGQAQSVPAPEKFNTFIEQIAQQEPLNASILMKATMESLSKDPKGYRQMLDLAEKRFSDPADPIHNEELYMIVLEHAYSGYVLSGSEKEKQRLLLEGAKKNMIGSIAADFDYVTPKDNTAHRLKELQADYILVFFNNPDCESCEKVKERLAENELINRLVKEKKLIVLGIYPYEDQKMWKKTKYPSMMVNGWNQSQKIEYAELYDLPTLPCFYLLDSQYKVLMKNEGSLNKVEAMLQHKINAQDVGPTVPADLSSLPTRAKKEPAPAIQVKPQVNYAPADDPLAARSEQMFDYMLNNKSQELYDNMSEQIQSQTTAQTFDGAMSKVEQQMGKYQSHDAWRIQEIQGLNTYSTLLHFDKGAMGLFIVYDEDGKMKGMNLVPMTTQK